MKILALLLAVLLSSCGGGGGSSPVATLPPQEIVDTRPVFIGDSITANWPSAVKNSGIGGENSDSIRARLNTAIHDGAEFLHILAGTNDDIRNIHRTIENIEAMALYAMSLNIPVIVGTIPPYDEALFWQAPFAGPLNVALKARMQIIGVKVADYYAAMIGHDGKQNAQLFMDGIHPNSSGYAVMDAALQALRTK